jgi:hypothetical protein
MHLSFLLSGTSARFRKSAPAAPPAPRRHYPKPREYEGMRVKGEPKERPTIMMPLSACDNGAWERADEPGMHCVHHEASGDEIDASSLR